MNRAHKDRRSGSPWFAFLNDHSAYQRDHVEYNNRNNDHVGSETCRHIKAFLLFQMKRMALKPGVLIAVVLIWGVAAVGKD